MSAKVHRFEEDQMDDLPAGPPNERPGVDVPVDKLLVILTSGPEDGGKRATLAASAACSAAALGRPTTLFLVGDGAYWAYQAEDRAIQTLGFPPLSELMDELADLGVEMLLCSACDSVCAAEHVSGSIRRRGVSLCGFASVLSQGGRCMTLSF